MNELSLFTGGGGGLLGAHMLGWRTVCAVEIERDCQERLLQRQREGFLPRFPIWDDVKTFDGRPWRGCVDIVSGGFPCTDISAAGKGAGIEGTESGLWKEMARICGDVRPRYVWIENSPLLTGRGLDVVLWDLAALGFDAVWGVVSSADAGGSSLRERIWILAYTPGARPGQGEPGSCGAFRDGSWWPEPERRGRSLVYAEGTQDGRRRGGELADSEGRREGGDASSRACGEDVALGSRGGRSRILKEPCIEHGTGESGMSDRGRGGSGKAKMAERYRTRGDGLHEREQPGHLATDVNGSGSREGAYVVANGKSIRRISRRSEPTGEQGRPDVLRGELGDTDRAGLQERGQAGTPTRAERDAEAHADAERPGGTGAPVEPGLGGDSHGLATWLDSFAASGRPPVAGRGPEQFPWEPPRTCKGFKDRVQRIRAIGNGQDPWAMKLAWEILRARI